MSWLLTGERDGGTGGPYQTSVIPSFGGHIACSLWEDPLTNDRGVLTPYTRERTLNSLGKLTLKDEVAMGMVISSGLSHLPKCMMQNLDLPLLSAFVERWQPDTNTFHMPFGEITILLHDVFYILRVPVDGDVCSGICSPGGLPNDIGELLGFCPEDLSNPWLEGKSSSQIYRSGGVLVSALQHVTEKLTHPLLAAQGYLLLLLGSTLFVDKSSDRIRAAVNTLLKDASKVKAYAWGAGCLAYMYRQLGVTSRADSKGLCGCLTLLQAWIYEYFPSFRPSSTFALQLGNDSPRALMWGSGRRGSVSDKSLLRYYRTMIDKLVAEQVDWLPYGLEPVTKVSVSRFHGTIRFVDVIECYHPDRCLRQFGFTQTIPKLLITPEFAYRSSRPSMYDVRFPEWSDMLWQNRAGHLLVLSTLSTPALPTHAHAPGYLEWWLMHSHPYVINTVRSHSRRVRSLSTSSDDEARARVTAVLGAFERIAPALLIPQDQRPPGLEELWKHVDEITPLLRQFRGGPSTREAGGASTSGADE